MLEINPQETRNPHRNPNATARNPKPEMCGAGRMEGEAKERGERERRKTTGYEPFEREVDLAGLRYTRVPQT